MRCESCNGHGDTGPAYEPDPCGVCRGTGLSPCDYCGQPALSTSLSGTNYCSLECLCNYNAKKQARLPLEF